MVGKLIRRMVACGIPKKTAFRIWLDFERRGKREALLAYIEAVEHERMADV